MSKVRVKVRIDFVRLVMRLEKKGHGFKQAFRMASVKFGDAPMTPERCLKNQINLKFLQKRGSK